MAGMDPKEWQHLASQVAFAGVQAIELNFSCPHGMPERGLGAAIGGDADLVRTLTGYVRDAISIPLIVKLTPNVTDIVPIAQAAVEGGADMISAINTVQSLMGVDIETFEPAPSVAGYSTYGGYSGPGVKPIGLRVVSQVARSTNVPVIGIGGVSSFEDATEYLLVGASAVQVYRSHVGRSRIIREMLAGLSGYLQRKGTQSG